VPNLDIEGSYCENNRNPVSENGQTAVLAASSSRPALNGFGARFPTT